MTRTGIFFDLDGTLLDTAPDFLICVAALRDELGMPPLADHLVREQVSNGSLALAALATGLRPDDPALIPHQQRLLALYQQELGNHAPLFDGLAASLAWLEANNIRWGIVTNKPLRYTEPLLAKRAWPYQPDSIICPEHVSQPKPHPEGLLTACRQTGCDPAQSWYLGDHPRDIDAGRAAGMQTVMCHWGYLTEQERHTHHGETATLHHGSQLLALLQQHVVNY